jgi:serine protease Do
MSRSVRAQPRVDGESEPADGVRSVPARTALVFVSGLVLGAGLGALSWSALQAPTHELEPAAAAIAKVAGWDTPASGGESQIARAELPEASAPRARAGKHAKPAVHPEPEAKVADVEIGEPDGVQTPAPRKPSEIARAALGFTAFVSGGRVYGAGVLLDRAGHVLTCRHVIEGLDTITVSFSDGASYPARVIDSDPALDIALLKIDSDRAPGLTPASVAGVELGDDVFALGAPRKMAFSLSRGMVSFVGRRFDRVYYLQTDLAMNGGSSGGPVLNDRGEVIALSSFVLRDSEGLAFALPIDYAYRRFASHLVAPARAALEGSAAAAFEGWLSALDRGGRDPAARE